MTNNNDVVRTMFAQVSCHEGNAIIDAIAGLYSVSVPRRIASRAYLKTVCVRYKLKLNDLIDWYHTL